jgi:serine/threonine protein kinase
VVWNSCIQINDRWKIADFGLSAKAESKRAYTTVYSRGTSCYRAPELLAEHAAFTNRVDIWALGCILHELATGKVAFHQDWAVREYFYSAVELPISLPSLPSFFVHHLAECIHDMLCRDWNHRPSASDVCLLFLSYSRLLNFPIASTLINAKAYPSYLEWKELASSNSNESIFFSRLSDLFEQKGETEIAKDMRQAIFNQQWVQFDDAGQSGLALTFEGQTEMQLFNKAELRRCKAAIVENPESFTAWHRLCKVYLRGGDRDAAIRACNQGNTGFPSNPWPTFVLANVYAAHGDYAQAISIVMTFFSDKSAEVDVRTNKLPNTYIHC